METLKKAVQNLAKKEDADIILYSGPINRNNAEYLIIKNLEKKERKKNVIFLLTTFGGDPDAAFQIARHLRRCYEKIILLINGYCKSAGTLISLSADEIVMSELGELGPLDVQVQKHDDIGNTSSVLDIFQSINFLSEQAIQIFDQYLINITSKSRGAITTKTASEISTNLTNGLISPIIGQIDPHRLGEMQRSISISSAYGTILDTPNVKPDTLSRLIYEYPTHSFVIDIEEAKSLFKNVRGMNDDEIKLCYITEENTRKPDPNGLILHLRDYFENYADEKNEHKDPDTRHHKKDDSKGNGKSKSDSKKPKSDSTKKANKQSKATNKTK